MYSTYICIEPKAEGDGEPAAQPGPRKNLKKKVMGPSRVDTHTHTHIYEKTHLILSYRKV